IRQLLQTIELVATGSTLESVDGHGVRLKTLRGNGNRPRYGDGFRDFKPLALARRSVAPGRGREFHRLGQVELDLEQAALRILLALRARQFVQEAMAGLDLHRPDVGGGHVQALAREQRSEEHTSERQSREN